MIAIKFKNIYIELLKAKRTLRYYCGHRCLIFPNGHIEVLRYYSSLIPQDAFYLDYGVFYKNDKNY